MCRMVCAIRGYELDLRRCFCQILLAHHTCQRRVIKRRVGEGHVHRLILNMEQSLKERERAAICLAERVYGERKVDMAEPITDAGRSL